MPDCLYDIFNCPENCEECGLFQEFVVNENDIYEEDQKNFKQKILRDLAEGV